VDSKVSPKFRFARGVGAGSARGCGRISRSKTMRWTVQLPGIFLSRGLRMPCSWPFQCLRAQREALDAGKTQSGQVHSRTTPTRQSVVSSKAWPWRSFPR